MANKENIIELFAKRFQVDADLLTWMAIHGFLCLALRHPKTKGHSMRPTVLDVIRRLEEELVREGVLDPKIVAEIHRVEAEEGSLDL